MFGELIPCGGGEPVLLTGTSLIVGRLPDCDVTVPHRTVSGKHCRLELRNNRWHVTDLDSRNGVTVNGKQCTSRPLMPNDVIGFAKQRYRIAYAAPDGPDEDDQVLDILNEGADQPGHDSHADLIPPEARTSGSFQRELGTLTPCGGGDPIPLLKPSLLVGRRGSCDIVLDFNTVSGRHCRLEIRDGFWYVQDLNSRNGIRIDEETTDAGWVLPGSILTIARMRHELNYEPPEGQAPPVDNPFSRSLMEKAGLQRPADLPRHYEEDDDEPVRKRWELS